MTQPPVNFSARAVDNLKALFNIIIGLAIVESIKAVVGIDLSTKILSINKHNIFFVGALFFTILPFQQGASRYLDNKYINTENIKRKMEGIIDFAFFLIEAIIFYAAALSITQPKVFFLSLVIVLALDVIWIIFVFFSGGNFKDVWKWLVINLVAIFVIAILLYTPLLNDDTPKWIILSALCLVRTITDYISTWNFYWPKN